MAVLNTVHSGGVMIVEFTKDYVSKIPEPHRDFLLSLWPIIDSRRTGAVLRISGIPFSRLYGMLLQHHGYEPFEARQVADDLKLAGLVEEDKHQFFTPTGRGEALLLAMQGVPGESGRVPVFPQG